MLFLKPQDQGIQIFYHCSVSWKIAPLYFFSSNLTYFGRAHQSAKFQTFDCSRKFHQVCTLIGPFCWKYLKRYRGVMCHDTEEWCKIWRKTDLFQKWQKFGEFWPEHSEVSKICTFTGSFYAKYITLDPKMYIGVILHDSEEWCKMLRKTNLWFGKWHEEFRKFSPEHLKVSKLEISLDSVVQSRKCMN